jgi:UDP-2,3-diacylglucosamine hydrolase
MTPAGPPAPAALAESALQAPSHWRVVEFISDLHLQASQAATWHAWQQYLASTRADALFILGDLFELWVGDDVATAPTDAAAGFETRCQQLLAAASQRLNLYFMPGNRDFLLGPAFAQACGMTLLADPTVLAFDAQRWLLSHGDALCLDDTDYQQFRVQVRSPVWCQNFLAKPLAERQALARSLREHSEARKASGAVYADVDTTAALQWLQAARADTLIHGHTHQPADHLLLADTGHRYRRLVLSDWDAQATPPRLEVLQLRLGQAPVRIPLASGL